MQTYPLVLQHQYEWHYMLHKLSQLPINSELVNPTSAYNPYTDESWQYAGTFPINGQPHHEFWHNDHPNTADREVVQIPASRSYLHQINTPDQPNPALLLEWIDALRGGYVPQCSGVYVSEDGKANCATGLFFSIAGHMSMTGQHADTPQIRWPHLAKISGLTAPNNDVPTMTQAITWLLGIPQGDIHAEAIYRLQDINDKPTPFPQMADKVLSIPAIKDLYDQLTQPPDAGAAFNAWMERVNDHCAALCGITADDLPDQDYSAYFEDGYTPEETITEVMEELGYDEF